MNPISEKIAEIGIVPVIKLETPRRDAGPLARALCTGGVPVAEVTFRAAGAPEAIALMKETCPDMIVGAGTVTAVEQIDQALEAGAAFVVSPGLDPELVEYCQRLGVPVYPGCTTASEYHTALKLGLEVIKFFPAEQSGGLAKIKALAAPFPQFQVMPTGGIGLHNLAEYLACPVIAACGGSYMVTAKLIGEQNWEEITRLCRESREIAAKARANRI
ncbi:bifunctional 4-hydroxy-2-oxoglutarate aldolase/2-dehydro-3-deoxy-phosphogluconate aldolase [Acutalibacter sp. 1XD8-33]|uniref:bifunctional 4-hydroxy-2-oxoglutarate aldolase/2-dehydro-3-deoxy-phosphogluconate aldolase n=1 Tax=Acutalibacter sp. 1XD8-33 TaxID=2320081 RepID=UPI000EA1A6A3|nr:bifunctional 4-hydroxy-2-oxoglutarate aldolase/2-dehydro-3-deoxy-phosphogluconate aldolase [Acutalibacter sp. 1XD8-33]RKJ41410.1 bifunctional 4-hydroxy-2-oxoglutarate aldolase/2-dehydro-3-deoxy-phosphogluconate aldolase [Acutalibacter sp. 1XD8-33]